MAAAIISQDALHVELFDLSLSFNLIYQTKKCASNAYVVLYRTSSW